MKKATVWKGKSQYFLTSHKNDTETVLLSCSELVKKKSGQKDCVFRRSQNILNLGS